MRAGRTVLVGSPPPTDPPAPPAPVVVPVVPLPVDVRRNRVVAGGVGNNAGTSEHCEGPQ